MSDGKQQDRMFLWRWLPPAGWLALLTAGLFAVLVAALGQPVLLAFALAYGGLAAALWLRHRAASPEDDLTRTAPPLPPHELKSIATRMSVTVDGLVRASQAINDVIRQQSHNADEQASMIHQANDHLDEFLRLSERISEQARQIIHSARRAASISENGQTAIRASQASMEDIRQQVEAIAGTIVTLSRLTGRIDEIITAVSEIATQSNTLALNASIEAARAGTQGRGFAIVADEVRALSRQSTDFASQVRAILTEIRQAMRETVEATQHGMENVEAGIARTTEADEVMVELSRSVTTSREAMDEIYAVIRRQSEGMEEISISMDRIERLTEQNLTSTRTFETVSANLSRLAADLQTAVEQGVDLRPSRRQAGPAAAVTERTSETQ